MKAATREWIKKAESDYQMGRSLMRRRKVPTWDHACFFFQQAAEKYIKGRLEEAGVRNGEAEVWLSDEIRAANA